MLRADSIRAAAALAVTALVLGGCISGATFRERADEIRIHTERTHDAALRCGAERQIALAEAHADFLEYEMLRGKYVEARRHLDVAQRNIDDVRRIVDGRPECFGIVVVSDIDADGIPDDADNCPRNPNPAQMDTDGDGLGDECDEDLDGDGIPNRPDNCPFVPNNDQADSDGDGIGDACSEDRDGDGIVNSADRCPDVPEDRDDFEDADGCPDPDNDRDGRDDPYDDCPNDPEDIDGFEDADGCPDPDNDADTILDVVDDCPLDPEDFDGFEDEDGCPEDDSLVVLTQERIEIREQINFELDSATITGRLSFRILDDVAVVLYEHPELRVRVEGHTDDQGSDRYNLDLSQERASAVRLYLVQQGIDPGRLTAVGFGEQRPIESNATPEGRAANRRVEFHIVDH